MSRLDFVGSHIYIYIYMYIRIYMNQLELSLCDAKETA